MEIPGNSYKDGKSPYTFRLDEQENLWEYYFECFARLKQKVDETFKLSVEGFGEELSTGLTAIREALVNLLMPLTTNWNSTLLQLVSILQPIIIMNPRNKLPLKSKELSWR